MKAPKIRFHIDSVIMSVAALVLLISVYFLIMGDGFGDGEMADLQAVGTFKLSTNDVRRRVDAGMTWGSVEAPTKVYEGDSIFTGDKSEASIQLDNGTIIKVDPKSLVVIHTKGNRTTIDLQYGSLQGKIAASAEPIVINQDGKQQELRPSKDSQIRIVKREKEKTVRVQVEKGQVKVDNEDVGQDEVVKISDAKPVVEKSTITLLSPADGEPKWLAMGSSLAFKWKTSGSASRESLKIEFSRDGHFAKPLYSASVSGGQALIADSNLPVGAFYWRVKPANGEASLSQSAMAYPDVAPLPVLPKDNQIYQLDADRTESTKTVFLTWEDKSGSTDYAVEVARDADFRDVVKTAQGREKVARVADLPFGDYFWHVKGRNAARANAPFSRTMKFSIKEGAKAPTAPALAETDLNYMIPDTVLASVSQKQALKGRGVKPVAMTPFTWAPTENASNYEVEVSNDPTFSNAVRQDNGSATTFTPREVRPGKLYFRVRAQSADGRVSPVSKIATLNVSIPAPRLRDVKPYTATFKSQEDFNRGTHEFALAWNSQAYAASYELQWGSDVNFTKSKIFKVRETQRLLKVTKPDSYAARVRSLDADGNPISAFSSVEVAKFAKTLYTPPPVVVKKEIEKPRVPASQPTRLVGLMPGLPVVQLREPASNSALVSLEDAPTFVTFKWKPVKGASSYTIQIASDADFSNVVSEQKVPSTGYVFQKGLPEGKVFWRVRANVKQGFSNWSDPSGINVIYQ